MISNGYHGQETALESIAHMPCFLLSEQGTILVARQIENAPSKSRLITSEYVKAISNQIGTPELRDLY